MLFRWNQSPLKENYPSPPVSWVFQNFVEECPLLEQDPGLMSRILRRIWTRILADGACFVFSRSDRTYHFPPDHFPCRVLRDRLVCQRSKFDHAWTQPREFEEHGDLSHQDQRPVKRCTWLQSVLISPDLRGLGQMLSERRLTAWRLRSSSGLRYWRVVSMLEWPRSFCTVTMSAPLSRSRVA